MRSLCGVVAVRPVFKMELRVATFNLRNTTDRQAVVFRHEFSDGKYDFYPDMLNERC
jgi:hypothetical protein